MRFTHALQHWNGHLMLYVRQHSQIVDSNYHRSKEHHREIRKHSIVSSRLATLINAILEETPAVGGDGQIPPTSGSSGWPN